MTTPTTEPSMAWIEAALLIFLTVFLVVTIGVLVRRRGHFDRAAQIPLSDEPVSGASAGDEHQRGETHD